MLSFRYVENNNFIKKEIESLYNLFEEEKKLKKALETNNYLSKLYVYGKNNKFKLNNIGNLDFKESLNKFEFIIVKDKKEKVLGYLCFEKVCLDRKEEPNILLIVKHMYISNALNYMDIDYLFFFLLENLFDACIIYTSHIYRSCTEFSNYSKIVTPFSITDENKSALKIKKDSKNTFLFFEDSKIKKLLNKYLAIVE